MKKIDIKTICCNTSIPKDVKSFGLIPEIIGRLPVLTFMHPLDGKTLRSILTEPKNALIKQYEKLFELDGIKLDFTPGALDYIVEKALEYNLGARGLRSLCEAILNHAMFEMPGGEVNELKVTKILCRTTIKKSKHLKLKSGFLSIHLQQFLHQYTIVRESRNLVLAS